MRVSRAGGVVVMPFDAAEPDGPEPILCPNCCRVLEPRPMLTQPDRTWSFRATGPGHYNPMRIRLYVACAPCPSGHDFAAFVL